MPVKVVFWIPLLIVLCVSLVKKAYNISLLCGIYALCLGSVFIYYIYLIVLFCYLIFAKKSLIRDSYSAVFGVFKVYILYLLAAYAVQLLSNGSLLSLPLYLLTFVSSFTVLFFIILSSAKRVDGRFLVNHVLSLTIAQCLIALVFQAIPTGIANILNRPTLGDRVMGTTASSKDLSFLLICSVIFYISGLSGKMKVRLKERVGVVLLILFTMSMIFLNDSKAQLYAYFIAVVGLVSYRFMLSNRLGFVRIVIGVGVIVLCLNVVKISSGVGEKIASSYGEYITGKYNAKVQYYQDAFSLDTRNFWEYLFGTGPGTNGSRASNALAYDVMYKKENTVTLPSFIPPSSSEFTRKYLSGLYDEEYAEKSGNRSAMLGNPFNSICALYIEMGLIGFVLVMLLFLTLIKEVLSRYSSFSNGAFVLFIGILVNAFIDQTFEVPMAMFLLFLVIGIGILQPTRLNVLIAPTSDENDK